MNTRYKHVWNPTSDQSVLANRPVVAGHSSIRPAKEWLESVKSIRSWSNFTSRYSVHHFSPCKYVFIHVIVWANDIYQKGDKEEWPKEKPYSCYTKEAIDLKPPSLMWLARELSPVFTILPLSCKLKIRSIINENACPLFKKFEITTYSQHYSHIITIIEKCRNSKVLLIFWLTV